MAKRRQRFKGWGPGTLQYQMREMMAALVASYKYWRQQPGGIAKEHASQSKAAYGHVKKAYEIKFSPRRAW